MAEIIRLKKGLNIPLVGSSSGRESRVDAEHYGIVPDDFPGYSWKLQVKAGEHVETGSALLRDKETGKIAIVSPVSGTVEEVVRGERRKIEVIKIKKEGEQKQAPLNLDFSEKGSAIDSLSSSGLWGYLRQRPYDIIPSPEVTPRDIFVTAFDSAPLAGEMLTKEMTADLEEGMKLLTGLTTGKVYMGIKFGSGMTSTAAEVFEIQGPHPAGNVGVQIANIKPVNKGETVWALDARTVARIGHLVKTGELDFSTIVDVTGECIKDPHRVLTTVGASLRELLRGNLKDECSTRVISGNVLTGKRCIADSGYLRFPYRQITSIPEGDDRDEFMGWASLDPNKYSVKRSFPAFLKGLAKPFKFDARIKGGHRAMILSGEYDKVFPMDIYPEYLIKAILAKDIDKMEQLGIYEVAPEDFALAEFVDTSKNELQQIVADGLAYLRKELS